MDALSILNARTKRIEGYCYKLDGVNQYGLDTVISGETDIDERNMSIRFPFADGNRRDGVGDLIEVEGIRTERHRMNPLVLFDHGKNVQLPIGLAECPETKQYTVEIDPISRSAWVKAFFYQGKGLASVDRNKEAEHALFCEQLFDLMAKKYVRGGSIGYQTIKAMQLPPDYNDLSNPPQPGMHLIITLMLEASAVVMPCNADTTLKALSLPTICGKPPSPYLTKSLSAYAPPRKAQLGYEGKQLKQPKKPSSLERKPQGPKEGIQQFDRYPYGKIEGGEGEYPQLPIGDSRTTKPGVPKPYAGPETPYGRKKESGKFPVTQPGPNPIIYEDSRQMAGQILSLMSKSGSGYMQKPWSADEIADGVNRPRGEVESVLQGLENAGRIRRLGHNGQTTYHIVGGRGLNYSKSVKTIYKSKSIPPYGGQKYPKEVIGTPGAEASAQKRRDKQFGWSQLTKDHPDDCDCFRCRRIEGLPGDTDRIRMNARTKYRKTKNFRRKTKGGTPGSAIIRINARDLDRVRDIARTRGLKVNKVVQSGEGGTVNISLSGDDTLIDQIGVEYGRPVGSSHYGRKQMKSGTKNLSGPIGQGGYRNRKNPSKDLRNEALRLLNLYCDTAFEGYREKAWDCLIASGMDLAGISRTKQGAEQLMDWLAGHGYKPDDELNTSIGQIEVQRKPIGVKSTMKYKVKASPAPGGPAAPMPEDGGMHPGGSNIDDELAGNTEGDETMEIDSQEPYGAQVLRKIHEDHMILLEDYDGMLTVLENENVKGHLTQLLEAIEETLTATEGIFEHEYEELEGLEGGEGEKQIEHEMEDEGEGEMDGTAPSSEESVPTEEEAVEGMQSKALNAARRLIRAHYKELAVHGQGVGTNGKTEPSAVHAQGVPSGDNKDPHAVHGQGKPGKKAQPSESVSPKKARQILHEGEARGHKLTEKQRGMFGAAASRGKEKNFVNDEAGEVEVTKPSSGSHYNPGQEAMQQHTESAVPGGTKDIPGVGSHEPGEEAGSGSELRIHPLEAASASNAAKFIKDLTEYPDGEEFSYEKRLEAYHLHKLLDPIQGRFEEHFKNFVTEETSEVEVEKPSGPLDYHPNKEPMQQHTESVVPGGTAGSKAYATKHRRSHEFYKTVGDTSGFLKELSSSISIKWNPAYRSRAKELYDSFKNFVSDETGEVEVTKPNAYSTTLGDEPMQQHTESTTPSGTGVHGSSGKSLKETFVQHSKEMQGLKKTLEKLVNLKI